MKLLKFLCLILLVFSINTFANPIDSTIAKRYSENDSYWGLKLGRFHYGGDFLNNNGISITFLNEFRISQFFYLGGSLQIYKTIEADGGAISLNEYLSYPLTIADQKFFVKGGIGLATLGYINPVAMFEVEYIVFDFDKSAISISVQQSFPKLPFIVTIGILF